MENITNPMLADNIQQFEIQVDTKLFSKETINAVVYKYSGKFYIQQTVNNNIINISFKVKENADNISKYITDEFFNDLIDQQFRYETNKIFGHIRDLIVEEAFKPVNSKK